ncbi:LicD family protein [Lapidilactobacillus dextrinicus]|uniref:LicD family protein n=1 Tax=Lapidilactobacillus dextrinicus TaxID=51664 RepID=UPI0022E8CD48|nr:LicD family protein [Lapidilactobacillus dextrinicus]
MTPIQEIELQALKEIKKITDKHHIRFFLRGGSVMGAVKYHGFVPWDDDMDIAIPREDYQKFIKIFSRDWSDIFWMASYLKNDDIHCYFPRIMVKEEAQKKLNLPRNNHLGFSIIDVLPLDYLPNTIFGRAKFIVKVALYRILGSTWTSDIKDTINLQKSWKRVIVFLVKQTKVSKRYSQNEIYDKLDKIYTKYSPSSTWRGTVTGSGFQKEMFPKNYWGAGKLVPFEDTQFYIPDNYDKYLKKMYGKNYASKEPSYKKSHIMKNNRVIGS